MLRNRHKVEHGDVFLMTNDSSEDMLFLVDRADEFVSSTFQCASAKGHAGEIVSRDVTRSNPDDPRYLLTYALDYVISRWYMDAKIRRGHAVRLAHFSDLEVAREAIRAWVERRTDSLEVPVSAEPELALS